jgi:hypothetical protein
MNSQPDLAQDLRHHLTVCQEILSLSQRENQSLRDPTTLSQFEVYQARKALLPRLDESLSRLRQARLRWQKMTQSQRAEYPEIPPLLRQTQDLVMRIIVLDRENEQTMLRRGMIPPRHIPPVAAQRPHFVADLYRRNQVG